MNETKAQEESDADKDEPENKDVRPEPATLKGIFSKKTNIFKHFISSSSS